jgi:predicted phage terminase large subunit-like protein
VTDSPNITPDSLQAEICRRSFYEFEKRFWHVVIETEPVWNWHIRTLCEELQIVAERVFKGEEKEYDLLINVPPGSTKSTTASIMFPAWCWCRMSSIRTISGSYTHELALSLGRKSRLVIKSELYQRLFGAGVPGPGKGHKDQRVILRDDQDTKTFYETIQGGDRHCVGSEGDIGGFHGHFIIVDDPINPNEVHSPAALRKVNRWMNESLFSRKVDKKVSVIILIMQRLHEEDPAGAMMEMSRLHPDQIKLRHICLPAEESDRVKPKRLRLKYTKDKDGHSLLDPVRINYSVLQEWRIKLGPFGYSGQIEQWPVPPEGGMFKVDRIQIGAPPPVLKFHRICRYWDKAGSEMGQGAETAGVKMGEYMEWAGGKVSVRLFWILDAIHGRWDSGERERIIRQTAEADGKNVIICVEQEPGSGGKESAQGTVRNLAGYTIGKDKVTGDKILRADPFSVQVNEGNVRALQGALWWPYLRDQLSLFPMAKLKDGVDAASGAFAVLTNKVRVGALFGKR